MDRNPIVPAELTKLVKSLSARRAWIEIANFCRNRFCPTVALRKESVDRNLWWGVRKAVGSLVALRKESVDRNTSFCLVSLFDLPSLSARRAWIEIGTAWVQEFPKL